MNRWSILMLVSILGLWTGCVSTQKYTQLQSSYTQLSQKLTSDSIQSVQHIARLTTQKDSLANTYDRLTNLYLELKNDSVLLNRNYQRNKSLLDDLFEKYDRLDKAYKQVTDSIGTETATKAQDLSQKEKDLQILEQKLLAQQAQNEKTMIQLHEREIPIEAAERKRQKMKNMLTDWKNQLVKAGFPPSDSVFQLMNEKEGLILRIPESALLDTNLIQLTSIGKIRLKPIASLVKNSPEVRLVCMLTTSSTTSRQTQTHNSFRKIEKIAEFLKKEGVTLDKVNTFVRYVPETFFNTKNAYYSTKTLFYEIIIAWKEDDNFSTLQKK